MGRPQVEEFKQDRIGTTARELDPIRATDGMSEDGGLASLAGDGLGTQVVIIEVPDDARGLVLDVIHAYNSSGASGTFKVFSGTYVDPTADDPAIDETTERSITYTVASSDDRVIDYKGRAFEEDFIAVASDFAGEVALGVYNDYREYIEPDTEQTAVSE